MTLLLLLCLPASVVADELRVLISFERDSHRIEKVIKVENSSPVAALPQPVQTDQSARSGVLARWLDSSGNILGEEIIADPRITHAPTRSGPIPDKFLKPKGVYLLTAPAGSQQLWLGFPPVNLSSQPIPAQEMILSLGPG